ncbi:hypothetical protein [Salmonella enterica]|uniref:hypothetical protein n=1 Tax=Salmonella enterica TaxID=28901 RepID=UPI00223760EF|nr:hypothetical protein [Salmonella enterica]MCW6831680.1 hypothetical protein [Salmonella enterica]
MSLTEIVRNSLIETDTRGKAFDFIQREAGVPRIVAKRLLFSFLWFPTEETPQKIKDSGGDDLPADIKSNLESAVAAKL